MLSRQPLLSNTGTDGASGGLGKTLVCSSLTLLFLFLAANPYNRQQGANCEPSTQQQSRTQQPNELSQEDSFVLSNSDGLAALNSYGRPGSGAYVNSKRARKMSAFMPMRGRKDGRELLGADSLQLGPSGHHHQQQQQQHTYLVPISLFQPQPQQLDGQLEASNYNDPFSATSSRLLRESEPMSDDLSLSRLIGLAEGYSAIGSPGNRLPAGGTNNVPRQFVNQLEQISEQLRAQSLSNNNNKYNRGGGSCKRLDHF